MTTTAAKRKRLKKQQAQQQAPRPVEAVEPPQEAAQGAEEVEGDGGDFVAEATALDPDLAEIEAFLQGGDEDALDSLLEVEGDPTLPAGYTPEQLADLLVETTDVAQELRRMVAGLGKRRPEVVLAALSVVSLQINERLIERAPARAGAVEDASVWLQEAWISEHHQDADEANIDAAVQVAGAMDLEGDDDGDE